MKMYYGNTPVKKVNISHYEMNTNDATVMPSDLQAGVSCYARGQKVVGTGKSFEFAYYGYFETNFPMFIPSDINVIEVASTDNPIQLTTILSNMKNLDFSIENIIAKVIVDGISYDLIAQVSQDELTIFCEKDVTLQVFYGKDNYV